MSDQDKNLEALRERFPRIEGDVTPYELAEAINDALVSAELKVIPTQMMYNYARNHNPFRARKVNNRWTIKERNALEFAENYVEKRKRKAAAETKVKTS